MSGFILGAVQAAGQLFGGYGSVTIGPVRLTGLELPASMPVGGQQSLSVKQLPGGARQIDAMGPNYRELKWSGMIDSQDASQRVKLLNNICISGEQVILAWGVFSYTVIVSEFLADTKVVGLIPYSITCTVIKDNSSPQGQTLTSLASQVVADVSNGNVVGALSAVSAGVVSGPLSTATSAVGAAKATTVGSGAYAEAVSAVNTAAGAINTAIGDVNTTLAPLGVNLGSLSQAAGTALNTAGVAGQITQAVSACGDLANLSTAAAYIGRTAKNLANASA